MSIDGTYAFIFSGETGSGLGVIQIKDGKLRGADSGNIIYSRTVKENVSTGEIAIDLIRYVPAGTWLVAGGSEQDMPMTREQHLTLPPRLGDGNELEIEARPGVTKCRFVKVPDAWAAFANGFEIKPKNVRPGR